MFLSQAAAFRKIKYLCLMIWLMGKAIARRVAELFLPGSYYLGNNGGWICKRAWEWRTFSCIDVLRFNSSPEVSPVFSLIKISLDFWTSCLDTDYSKSSFGYYVCFFFFFFFFFFLRLLHLRALPWWKWWANQFTLWFLIASNKFIACNFMSRYSSFNLHLLLAQRDRYRPNSWF